MALKIIVKPPAELDVEEITEWYELHEERLGEQFVSEFKNTSILVSEIPLAFSKRYKSVRSFSLKKFPYNIFYIIQNQTMFIIAVLHQKRNPKIWKTRM